MILDSFIYQDDHMICNGSEKLVFRMNSGAWMHWICRSQPACGTASSMVIPVSAELADIKSDKMHRTISVTTVDPEAALHLDVPIISAIGNEL